MQKKLWKGTAEFDETGLYRYALTRQCHPDLFRRRLGSLLFIMLNPSTADATVNDATITRCMGYADRIGFDRLVIGNLCALRSTDPKALFAHPDPVGPDNDRWLKKLIDDAAKVVVAWGDSGKDVVTPRVQVVAQMLLGKEVYSLGLTRSGTPRHPSRLPKTAPLCPWDPARAAAKAKGDTGAGSPPAEKTS